MDAAGEGETGAVGDTDGDGEGCGVMSSGGGGGGVTCMTNAKTKKRNGTSTVYERGGLRASAASPYTDDMIAGPSMHDEAGEILTQIVSAYNAGVRTRDFSGFLALLADDAVFDFEGVSERGPLEGKATIARHFGDDPPDDPIRVKRWRSGAGQIVAEFAWADIPEGGGCLFIEPREGRVARLTLALGRPRRLFR